MKKVLMILICLAFVLTGCANQKEIMSDYIDLLEQEASETTVAQAESYLDKYLGKMDETQADYMVMLYEDYVKTYDSEHINYEKMRDRYGQDISDMLDKFYFIKDFEQQHPLETDGKLNYDWEEIVSRALSIEEYIGEYKAELQGEDYSKLKTNVTFEYEFYIRDMLQGTIVNPTFNYETGRFDSSAVDIYVKVAGENPAKVTSWVINQYFEYLQDVDFKLNYKDSDASKSYYDICSYITSEAGKRVYE